MVNGLTSFYKETRFFLPLHENIEIVLFKNVYFCPKIIQIGFK
jgi:hypothetical protein